MIPTEVPFQAGHAPPGFKNDGAGQFAGGFLESHKRLARQMSSSVDEAIYKPGYCLG